MGIIGEAMFKLGMDKEEAKILIKKFAFLSDDSNSKAYNLI